MKTFQVVYRAVYDDDPSNTFASSRFANIPRDRFVDADSIDEAKAKVIKLVSLAEAKNTMRTFKVHIFDVIEKNASQ